MTSAELLNVLKGGDLVELGMLADDVRSRRHPDGIVTYCGRSEADLASCAQILFPRAGSPESLIRAVADLPQPASDAVQPIFTVEITGAEYLTQVAVCRLCLEASNIQVNPSVIGLKLAQLALRFGANDLGCLKNDEDEENYRALIREAGFVPRRRDAAHAALFLQ